MKQTDIRPSLWRAEKALDWLEDTYRRAEAHSLSISSTGNVQVRVDCDDSEDGFEMVARKIGATSVGRTASSLHAGVDAGPGLHFFVAAGSWWNDVPEDRRDDVAEQMRADVLAQDGDHGPLDPCGCSSTLVDFEGHRVGCERHNPWKVEDHCAGCSEEHEHDWEPLVEGDRAYGAVCTHSECGARSERARVSA